MNIGIVGPKLSYETFSEVMVNVNGLYFVLCLQTFVYLRFRT